MCIFFLGSTKYISQKRGKIMTFSECSHSLYLAITPIFLDMSLISSEQLVISLPQHKCKIFHPAKLKETVSLIIKWNNVLWGWF